MKLSLFIAKRYLFAKKKQHIINIISWISIAGIVVGTMAIIIVISVLNGFNKLIGEMYGNFDPDIKITAVEGKMFNPDEFNFKSLQNHDGIIHYAEIIEEVALLKYGSQIYPAKVKGVPNNYVKYTNIDKLMIEGNYILENQGINYAVIGSGVAYNLSLSVALLDHIMIYVPKKGRQFNITPANSMSYNYVYPAGIFTVLEEIDAKYILVSFDFAAKLFESEENVSAVELALSPSSNAKKLQNEIQQILGDEFHVKNKSQQHDLIFKTMQSEKWVAFLILIFILVLASGNMIGNLTMLVIDKKEDITILKSMGATSELIRKIFLFEGWLITLVGAIIGSVLGVLFCWLQIRYGFITFPGNTGSFIVSAYPVQLIFVDVLLAFISVLVIGFLVSWYPVRFISQKYLLN